jgi:formylglycine-generating enzyme required for sulfatase activity/serine/threonine protein kinase
MSAPSEQDYLRQLEETARELRQALRINPQAAQARRDLAGVLSKLGRNDEAGAVLQEQKQEQTLTLGPAPQGTLTLGPGGQETLTLGPGAGPVPAAVPASDWLPGAVIDELYEVRGELGEGGFGTVHKVYHRGWKLELAVKSLRGDRLGSRRAVESFVQEANTWVGLGLHPNIVTCYFVRVLGAPRIFIEYMEGGSLADWLKAGKVGGLPEALDAAVQIARAMAYAHGRGLVHRDLKPGNCLLTPGRMLKVTDFGLAKVGAELDEEPEGEQPRGAKIAKVKEATQTGRLGTPEYMAPEQWDRPREAGPAADAWAFGVMLYELCLGRKPFCMAEDEPVDSFYARLLESNWAYEQPQGLPAVVVGLMGACLSVDPAKRPADFKNMAVVLEAAYEASAGKAYPREAVKEPPLLADTMVNQGVSMADLGRADEALRLFGEALKLDPTHPGAIYDQGVLLVDAGKLEAGELARRLEECGKTRPKEWIPRYLAALTQLLRGDMAAARFELEAASSLSHGNALVARAQRRVGEGSGAGLDELFVVLPRGAEGAAMEEGAFKSLLGRAQRELAEGKLAEACATAMKARGVKGYERAAEALEFLRRVGAKGVRSRLRGGWQKRLIEGSEGALAVAMSPDGKEVLSGHAGSVVKRWGPLTGRCAGTAALEGGLTVRPRCQTPDGRYALEGAGKALRVSEQGSGKTVLELAGHVEDIAAVCLCPDGGLAYTAGADGVRSWELDWEYDFPDALPGAGKAGGAAEPLITRRAALVIAGVVVAVVVAGIKLVSYVPRSEDRLAPVTAGGAARPAAPAVAVKEEAPAVAAQPGPVDGGEAEQARLAKVAAYAAVARRLLAEKKYMAAVTELKKANALGGSPDVDALFAQIANPAPAEEARPRASAGKAGIAWVSIPGGTFTMGSGNGDEGPRHQVTVGTFQMAKTLVTNKQYKACVEAGACTLPSSYVGGDDQPVVNVDWSQAKTFSKWVGGRLPSEAEWEYAARSAGKDWEYPWGNEAATCERAVISEGGNGCGRNSTWPVCSKPKGNTKQGLCDMAGNVWEWVQDWYHGSYNGAPTDGSAWEDTGSGRVYRGGSWNFDAGFARSAYRNNFDPADRYGFLGFRPAR